MARRISITIPDDIERTVLALMEAQGDPQKEGAFSAALIGHIRDLSRRVELQERTIAALERAAASGSAPASPAPTQAPTKEWGGETW